VIEHDVKRLDRLITDIADASRLDAEMQRQEAVPVNLTATAHHGGERRQRRAARRRHRRGPGVRWATAGGLQWCSAKTPASARVIDNWSRTRDSVSPQGGTVRRHLPTAASPRRSRDRGRRRRARRASRSDEQDLRPLSTPTGATGTSARIPGLAWSISRQIVEAHDGRLLGGEPARSAGRRRHPDGCRARFNVHLPAM